MRIAIGGLYQESHSFSPAPAGHDCVPLSFAATNASGMPVRRDCIETLSADLLARLKAALPVDGVFLAMHGATVAEHRDDPTGHLFSEIRQLVGPGVPIAASVDLHANITRQMVADAVVGYHTAPHIDQRDTGARAMRALLRALDGTPLTAALRQIPMIVPGENARTTDGPYSEVMDDAIALESQEGILSASVFCVQPWLDLPEMGCCSVVVTENDEVRAQAEADRLAQDLWSRRRAFTPDLVLVDDGLTRALADDRRPYVFSDSSDAPSSGAPGDSTVLIKAVLDRKIATPVLLNIVDAAAVALAIDVGVGNQSHFTVGAGLSDTFYDPVSFEASVKTLFDGSFRFKGAASQGVEFHMGRTAVLVSNGLHLVVMERPIFQWDPELYRCVGLEPTDAKIVVAKSPAAFRAAYKPFAAEILNIDCPGVCSPNLKSFPWKRVTRPIYPLDDDTPFDID